MSHEAGTLISRYWYVGSFFNYIRYLSFYHLQVHIRHFYSMTLIKAKCFPISILHADMFVSRCEKNYYFLMKISNVLHLHIPTFMSTIRSPKYMADVYNKSACLVKIHLHRLFFYFAILFGRNVLLYRPPARPSGGARDTVRCTQC